MLTVYPIVYKGQCLTLYQDTMDRILPINLVCFYGIGIFVMDVLAFRSNKFLLSLISIYIPDEGFCVVFARLLISGAHRLLLVYTCIVFLVDISMDDIKLLPVFEDLRGASALYVHVHGFQYKPVCE